MSNYYCSSYLELKHLAPSRAVRCASSEADCRRTMSAELKKACERRSDRRKRFPLGLGDGWTDSEGDGDNETVTQVPKKTRVCLSLNKKQSSGPTSEKENVPTSSRWRFLSEVEQDSLAKSVYRRILRQ